MGNGNIIGGKNIAEMAVTRNKYPGKNLSRNAKYSGNTNRDGDSFENAKTISEIRVVISIKVVIYFGW